MTLISIRKFKNNPKFLKIYVKRVITIFIKELKKEWEHESVD